MFWSFGLRFIIPSLLAALALTSCMTPSRDVALGGLDLNDPRVLQRLQSGLTPTERGAFAVYALRHWPSSRYFCGEALVDSSGRIPKTVGEAIAQTLAREEADAAAKRARERPVDPVEQMLRNRNEALTRRDLIIARQNVAQMQPDTSKNRAERAAIAGELNEIERLIRKLDKDLAGGK